MRKKIFSLVLLASVFLGAGVAFADPSPTFDSYNELRNAGGGKGDTVRVLKRVRYSSQAVNGPNIASGDVVVFDYQSADGVTIRLSTNGGTSGDNLVAGVAATAILTADVAVPGIASAADDESGRNWGWIIVHGVATTKSSAGGTTGVNAGDVAILSTDSGAVGGLKLGSAPTTQQLGGFGFFIESGDTGTSRKIFVTRM